MRPLSRNEIIHKYLEKKCSYICHKQFNHRDTLIDNIFLKIYSVIEYKLRKNKNRTCQLCGYIQNKPVRLYNSRYLCEQCILGEKENSEHRLG